MAVDSPENAKTLEDFVKLCLKRGIRITRKRRIIAGIICASKDHPNVEAVLRKAKMLDAGISQATVYRAIRVFEEAGALERHQFSENTSRFEVAAKHHHDHLIDVDTNEIIEFKDETIEALQEKVAKKLGYRLTGHTLELRGRKIVKE